MSATSASARVRLSFTVCPMMRGTTRVTTNPRMKTPTTISIGLNPFSKHGRRIDDLPQGAAQTACLDGDIQGRIQRPAEKDVRQPARVRPCLLSRDRHAPDLDRRCDD